jgi:hypothetical protein
MTDNELIRTLVYFSSGQQEILGPKINLDQWYYIVHTWDGTTSKQYVNGVFTGSGVTGSGTVAALTAPVEIGAWNCGNNFFDGKIGGVFNSATAMTEREIKAEYQRGIRRLNSTIDTNDTISDNDVAAVAADPAGKYVAVMGDDKVVYIFDEFGVPVASDTYPGTTARVPAIKSMLNGPDPHYVMAGSDQIEIVQPNTEIAV